MAIAFPPGGGSDQFYVGALALVLVAGTAFAVWHYGFNPLKWPWREFFGLSPRRD